MRGQLRARRSEDSFVRRASPRSSHQGFRDGERGRGRLLSHKGAVERRYQDSQLQVRILSRVLQRAKEREKKIFNPVHVIMKILNDAVTITAFSRVFSPLTRRNERGARQAWLMGSGRGGGGRGNARYRKRDFIRVMRMVGERTGDNSLNDS